MYNHSSAKQNVSTRKVMRAEFQVLLRSYTFAELETVIKYLGARTNKGWYSVDYLKRSIDELLFYKLDTKWTSGVEPIRKLDNITNQEKVKNKKKFNFKVDESLF